MTIRMRFMRPFTARVINPVTRRFAGWLPGFAILTHVGRASAGGCEMRSRGRDIRLVDPRCSWILSHGCFRGRSRPCSAV